MSEQPAEQPPAEPARQHPVRLVVADDLRRSRLTVFFRLLLAIPHLVWWYLWGFLATLALLANWLCALVIGRAPRPLARFLVAYLRYTIHVYAFLFLVGNPFPGFTGKAGSYPIDLELDPFGKQKRLVTLFRPLLAIPALIILYPATYLLAAAAFLGWFASLVRGRMPQGLRNCGAWALSYQAQAYAYLYVLTDRYPYSGPEQHVPEVEPAAAAGRPRLVVTDDLRRSRLTVFFRLLLAIPHLVWWYLWSFLAELTAVANWLCALVIGRAPRPLARFISAYVRYTTHVQAFLFLVGNPFPGFTGKAGSYPIDLELDPFGKQKRLVTLFRPLLAIPALIILYPATYLLAAAAFLGWFASLVRGRMPQGLRNCGAWALSYQAQAYAYLFVLTDRYPFSSPTGTWRAG